MLRSLAAIALLALALPVVAAAALTADATASPQRGGVPLTVTFDASASSAGDAYEWDFGDGATGSGLTTSHEYTTPGSYAPTLTVTSGADTATTTLSVVAQELALSLSSASVVHGAAVLAQGAVSPAEAGLAVTLEQRSGATWTTVATAATDAAGAFGTSFTAAVSGPVRARLDLGGATSPERDLSVTPGVSVSFGTARAFIGVNVRADVLPASYSGPVQVSVRAGTRLLAKKTVGISAGHLSTHVQTPWAGAVTVRLEFPATADLGPRTVSRRITVRTRTLRRGSSGPYVQALNRRLAQLRVHVAGIGTVFGARTYDSVIAFQKAVGLPRTGVVDWRTWHALGVKRSFRPRYARPTPHIEIDKSRQILIIVRNGVVTGIIPVSTGATGNTPVGAWRILWKAPATSTWLGSAILYRTMTFHGNFAIHGYYSVPPWPASHGCVRVPLWEANWLYVQSPVGERVFVYG